MQITEEEFAALAAGASHTLPEAQALILGSVYLPKDPGTPVGRFEFVVDCDAGLSVEVGTPVAAVTDEGTVVGAVIDMRTAGTASDPVRADLGGSYDLEAIASVPEVMVATVQVFHSERLRPIRAGVVRAATPEEMLAATGHPRMDWPIPAGVIPMADGSFAKICFDGHALLGPESAHLTVGGLSGQASKTSYVGTLLRSAIHAGAEHQDSVAALIFNGKGEDLIYLDEPPAAGYELTQEDLDIYEALGTPATPFEDVTVYSPRLPGSTTTRSPRPDALAMCWDLDTLWPYLKFFFPWMYEDEKLQSFLADFYENLLKHPRPEKRVDTFQKLEAWFDDVFAAAQAGEDGKENIYPWHNHHVATMRRIRRMLEGLVPRCGGLITRESARPEQDVPDSGWHHGQIVTVDIAGLQNDVQAAVIARTVERLMRSAEEGGLGVDHLVVFVDELNEFAPSQGAERSTVRKILQRLSTQGRYAGISLWGAGQKLSKVDELVRDNAATRALGITVEGELASGVYGRLPNGLSERIATLPKGQMALWHYSFRSALVVRFPRPAWRTGKPKLTRAAQSGIPGDHPLARAGRRRGVDTLGLRPASLERLVEGIPADVVEATIARADDPQKALEALQAQRVPDMRRAGLPAQPPQVDPSDPFDLG